MHCRRRALADGVFLWPVERPTSAFPGEDIVGSHGREPLNPRIALSAAKTHGQALWPVALLAVFTGWCGTVVGGASAAGAVIGHLLLLLAALPAVAAWRDPWDLGAGGRWLLAAFLVAVAASAGASDLPRAGRVAWALLPAFVLLPTAVARAWRDPRRRQTGLVALACLLAAVALWSLVGRALLGDPRAARPLGHHGLMAFWWLALLPLLWLGMVAARGRQRAVFVIALVLSVAAVLGTGSLLGITGLALQVGWLGMRRGGRSFGWLAAAAGLVALPRLWSLFAGRDPSAQARAVYWQGGLEGWLQRPWFGWGPGTTPWTLGLHLEPRPGISPPGEVVAELHSLPLQLLYELGGVGTLLLLALLAAFLWRRRRTPSGPLLGLVGAAWAGLGTAWLAVLALPVALAVVAGAALAPEAPRRGAVHARWGWVSLLLWAVVVLWAPSRGHWLFEHHPQGPRLAHRIDPEFPLYGAALAWDAPAAAASAGLALGAVEDAPGVAVFWLTAGVLGGDAGQPWADSALAAACQLDPFSPLAPFYRTAFAPASEGAAITAGRALLAEPRLAAAVFWEGREPLLEAALDEVETWPGIDAGWRRAMIDQVVGWNVEVGGEIGRLALEVDPSAAESLLLRTFRRAPRPRWLFPVELRSALASQVTVPPALVIAFNDAGHRGCDEGNPQLLWKTLRRNPSEGTSEPGISGG
ncbi:MAG: O-antigen ligase family protein [Acidobacteriota bacterium]